MRRPSAVLISSVLVFFFFLLYHLKYLIFCFECYLCFWILFLLFFHVSFEAQAFATFDAAERRPTTLDANVVLGRDVTGRLGSYDLYNSRY